MAKIEKDDFAQAIVGYTSNSKKIEERDARRAKLGLDPIELGDWGKQGVALSVFRDHVIVEGINRVREHIKANQNQRGGSAGGIGIVEAPIHISKVTLVGPDKKPIRVGHREIEVERDGRMEIMRERVGRRGGRETEL